MSRHAALVARALLVALTAACGAPRPAQSPMGGLSYVPPRYPVVMDGEFWDWSGQPAVVVDSFESPYPVVDLTAVDQQQDAQYVYLGPRLRDSVSLLSLRGTMSVVFDADGDVATGAELEGLPGAEFAVDFSPHDSAGRPREGVALRVVRGDGTTERADAHALDFMSQPNLMYPLFEMRVARGRRLGDSSTARPTFTGTSYRARVVVRDAAGALVDDLPAFTVPLTVPFQPAPEPVQVIDPLARSRGGDIRVLQWNMADRGLLERPDVFRRIIAALEPDVLLLHEVNGELGREGVERFLSSLESGAAPWQFSMGEGGGYQRSIVASRNAVTEYPEFRAVPFPDSVTAELLEAAPRAVRDRLRANLAAGVATGGALVEIGGKRLAAFPLDLQSAGNDPASWQERRRRAEARIIREHVIRALAAHGPVDGVVIAGDLNLVATEQPLQTLREPGIARGGRRLGSVRALQLDERTAATWDNREGPFPPGRLDWLLHDEQALEVRRAFVFDTRDLTDRWLSIHRLARDDSQRASDHMPIVVDFAWRP